VITLFMLYILVWMYWFVRSEYWSLREKYMDFKYPYIKKTMDYWDTDTSQPEFIAWYEEVFGKGDEEERWFLENSHPADLLEMYHSSKVD
jgi:hypothetical protein